MMEIKSISTNGSFALHADLEILSEIRYSSPFSKKANFQLHENFFLIQHRKILSKNYTILRNSEYHGKIGFNTAGNIEIKLVEQVYTLITNTDNPKSPEFMLINQEKAIIFTMLSNYNNKHYNYNYDVEVGSTNVDSHLIAELVVYAGYGAKLQLIKLTNTF